MIIANRERRGVWHLIRTFLRHGVFTCQKQKKQKCKVIVSFGWKKSILWNLMIGRGWFQCWNRCWFYRHKCMWSVESGYFFTLKILPLSCNKTFRNKSQDVLWGCGILRFISAQIAAQNIRDMDSGCISLMFWAAIWAESRCCMLNNGFKTIFLFCLWML